MAGPTVLTSLTGLLAAVTLLLSGCGVDSPPPRAATASAPQVPLDCATAPHACGYPDATNTGIAPGPLLRVPQDVTSGPGWHYDPRGWIEIDGPGAVFDRKQTHLGLDVVAPDVTISNSLILASGDTIAISLRRAHRVTIRDNEIAGGEALGPERLGVAIKDIFSDTTGIRVLRNEIRYASTGVQIDAGLIEDNYIHDLGLVDGDHVNGTTSNAGVHLLEIRHNTIFNPYEQTDAVSLFQDFGPQENRVIADNLLAGGGYTIYGGANPGLGATARDIRVTDNRIARIFFPNGGYYGPVAAWAADGNVWEGNIWDDTGAAIPAPVEADG
ncbi:hypothetical protein GCM10027600_31740 [Nocardioides ginsengisegetis]